MSLTSIVLLAVGFALIALGLRTGSKNRRRFSSYTSREDWE